MSVHVHFVCKLLVVASCATAVHSAAAPAADHTRYISITGSNANDCTLAAPCRTLRRGIRVTPVGGELHILRSGDYGETVGINKSMTILGHGNTVYLDNPITINSAGAVVALRGLTLNGQGTADSGINVLAAAAVHIEGCVIHGFSNNGIEITANGVKVFVLNSISRDNGHDGFRMDGESSSTIDSSRFENNLNGVSVISGGNATISRSITSGNSGIGTLAMGGTVSVVSTVAAQNGFAGFVSAQSGVMALESSVANDNVTSGLQVSVGGIARISNSTFIGNGTGIANMASTVETRQNNTVRGNTTDVSGALTPVGGI
jgi:hypothetical protein